MPALEGFSSLPRELGGYPTWVWDQRRDEGEDERGCFAKDYEDEPEGGEAGDVVAAAEEVLELGARDEGVLDEVG